MLHKKTVWQTLSCRILKFQPKCNKNFEFHSKYKEMVDFSLHKAVGSSLDLKVSPRLETEKKYRFRESRVSCHSLTQIHFISNLMKGKGLQVIVTNLPVIFQLYFCTRPQISWIFECFPCLLDKSIIYGYSVVYVLTL